jgi:hypothetical protein
MLGMRGAVAYTHIRRPHSATLAVPIPRRRLDALDIASSELGYDRGELLTIRRVFAFVEGEVDRLVYQELFGEQLRRAGIELIPMHGTKKMAAIIEADLLFDLTRQRVAVVVDNIVEQTLPNPYDEKALRAAARGQRAFDEELRKVCELHLQALTKGRHVHAYAIPSPDIIAELDAAAIRETQGCRYPGREESIAGWQKVANPDIGGPTWKRFCTDNYGLKTEPDDIAPVLGRMRANDESPDNLLRVVTCLVDLAERE